MTLMGNVKRLSDSVNYSWSICVVNSNLEPSPEPINHSELCDFVGDSPYDMQHWSTDTDNLWLSFSVDGNEFVAYGVCNGDDDE